MSQQQLLTQALTVSQIIRTYGKRFRQITRRYSDGRNGRCAMGAVLSYFGWDGKHDSKASESLQNTFYVVKNVGIRSGIIIKLNDSGMTFDEIADYQDYNKSASRPS